MCHSKRARKKFLYINTALPWHTKVNNSAYDNLYCSKNERWCSLHCFQYNAMYQTAKGYGVYKASPSQQITYWLRKQLNSHLWFLNWNADMKRAKSDNGDELLLLSAEMSLTSRCCWLSLPAGFILYLKHVMVW